MNDIVEHKCKEILHDYTIYYYKSKKRKEIQWNLYDGLTDNYINKIKYCPFCGVKL